MWRICQCGNGVRNGRYRVCEQCDPNSYWDSFFSLVTKHNSKMVEGYDKKEKFNLEADHIVPRWFIERYGISVTEGCSGDNLQWISSADNNYLRKGGMLPEKWVETITERKYEYFMNGVGYRSILSMCETNGISYVRVASRYIKNWPNGFEYGGYRFSLEESARV